MSDPTTTEDARVTEAEIPADPTEPEVLVDEELLVEDISIDGMCGVY